MDPQTHQQVISILEHCVEGALTRSRRNIEFKPFHHALFNKELVAAAAFERSFSTSFGQASIEIISKIIAEANRGVAERQKETMVEIPQAAVNEVELILAELREGRNRPKWDEELARLWAIPRENLVTRRVISDLWVQRDGLNNFFSIKTVKPNIDQTQLAKRDLLLLKAFDPECNVFFAIYYNPSGTTKAAYNWTPPLQVFNMHADSCVLIGPEYWNYLGGDGTYEELLQIFEEVGQKTRQRLLSEFS